MSSSSLQRLSLILLVGLSIAARAKELWLANTRGSRSVVSYNLETNEFGEDIVPAEAALEEPDHMVVDGDYLYVSHGTSSATSGILRMNMLDGTYDKNFISGGSNLLRPFGFAIYNGLIYVASFRSDEILSYDLATGDFVEQVAVGDGTAEGLINGPNQMAIHDGVLYLTTQGSVADGVGGIDWPGYPSQIVAIDLATGDKEIFVPQPEALGAFVSLLGIEIGCGDDSLVDDDCTMYTSDYAGGLRSYALMSKVLLYATYGEGAKFGALSIDFDEGYIYIPWVVDEASGAVLQFDLVTGENMTVVVESSDGALARPVGVLFRDDDAVFVSTTEEPTTEEPTTEEPIESTEESATTTEEPTDESAVSRNAVLSTLLACIVIVAITMTS
eukprot:CAMPEP_0202686902 /NCGR_PEP_ID=MMETSP1385-20130828/2653_1 /ASSEMBLY_ACC=CAM_ASM_000861 /TAXON_ID=933848 /ORGANISM="Elphidium margaritaceum" /LENGTH=386 /DNA_ID=CAMNT_0049341581 /DNA_START=77 /DNA_END=1240 /DNA_ORIENTATION=-